MRQVPAVAVQESGLRLGPQRLALWCALFGGREEKGGGGG